MNYLQKFIPLIAFISVCFLLYPAKLMAQDIDIYDEDQVSSIYITIDPDTLQFIIDNQINDKYFSSMMVYISANRNDTILQTGIRLKGNTSLNNLKKSFKLSFNEFKKGRKYQGVKKLNLLACVNDPTTMRQQLYYKVWSQSGLFGRRSAFVKLFINGDYRGIYTNLEEQDDKWLSRNFSADTGNLYKCTWPAPLVYLGDDQSTYKEILNDPTTRAYDLKTNEDKDDYSRLVLLTKMLNNPGDPEFKNKISQILDVKQVLKAYAIDILTGNWDDYFYLQNNYYLYDDPGTNKFFYYAYDTDNSFGIDWLGVDWLEKSYKQWYHFADPRPLITTLLSVPAFENEFIQVLDSINTYVYTEENLFPLIDHWKSLIEPSINDDVYYTLDYGYTQETFQRSFTEKVINHAPYGLKPFISSKHLQVKNAILSNQHWKNPILNFNIYPNPATNVIYIKNPDNLSFDHIRIFNSYGAEVKSFYENTSHNLDCSDWKPGIYYIRFESDGAQYQSKVIKY